MLEVRADQLQLVETLEAVVEVRADQLQLVETLEAVGEVTEIKPYHSMSSYFITCSQLLTKLEDMATSLQTDYLLIGFDP